MLVAVPPKLKRNFQNFMEMNSASLASVFSFGKARVVTVFVLSLGPATSMHTHTVKGVGGANGLREGLNRSVARDGCAGRRPSRNMRGQADLVGVMKGVSSIGRGGERYQDVAQTIGGDAQGGCRVRDRGRRSVECH